MSEHQGPGGTSLSDTVPMVQAVQNLPDEQKKALAAATMQDLPTEEKTALVQALPTEEKKEVATATMQALPAEKQEEVRRNTLGPPSSEMADKIWMNIDRTLIGAILISLVAVFFFVYEEKVDSAILPAILTAVLGYLVGIIQPKPGT